LASIVDVDDDDGDHDYGFRLENGPWARTSHAFMLTKCCFHSPDSLSLEQLIDDLHPLTNDQRLGETGIAASGFRVPFGMASHHQVPSLIR
jgi:hypothetical protein